MRMLLLFSNWASHGSSNPKVIFASASFFLRCGGLSVLLTVPCVLMTVPSHIMTVFPQKKMTFSGKKQVRRYLMESNLQLRSVFPWGYIDKLP